MLNPDSYAIDKVVQPREANFTIAAGTRITATTDLKPFYDSSATKFWNASGVKNTAPFGYAYPETQHWLYPDDQTYQTTLRSQVTVQYGGNVINNFFENIADLSPVTKAEVASAGVSNPKPALNMKFAKKVVAHPVQAAQEVLGVDPAKEASVKTTASNGAPKAQTNGGAPKPAENKPATAPASAQVPAQPQAPVQPEAHPPPSTPAPLNIPAQFAHLVPNRTYTEYVTNLRALKHGLSQTFRVYMFLGDFNPDPRTWPTEHNVVGRFAVLGRGGATPCAKCQHDAAEDLVVTGTVPLTSALLQDIVSGQLSSLDPEIVVPYLERNLHWRVTVFDGSEQPRDQVPGLKVAVVSTKVRIGDDGVPVYSGVYDSHPGITDGRPAGWGAGDQV